MFDGITIPVRSASERAHAVKTACRAALLWTSAFSGLSTAKAAALTMSGEKNVSAKIAAKTRRFENRPVWT